MKIGSKEHDEILKHFENNYNHLRLDKEPRGLWPRGIVYQDGEVNKLYEAYILGYSLGRVVYMQGGESCLKST